MRLIDLKLKNFRSIAETPDPIDLAHDVCLFYGPNGSGKTSVFDALELALTGSIGRLSHLGDVAHYLIRAQSPDESASVSLRAELPDKIVESKVEIGKGQSFGKKRGLLSPRNIESFRSTCYLSQSTIKSLVTCNSADLGRIIEAIIIDEASDIFIQGLLSANITRGSSQFATTRQRIETEERHLKGLADQVNAAKGVQIAGASEIKISEAQLANLRDLLREYGLATGSLINHDDVFRAIEAVERETRLRMNRLEQEKTRSSENISAIQNLIDRQSQLELSRISRQDIELTMHKAASAMLEAQRQAEQTRQRIIARRESSTSTDAIISALKLLQTANALSDSQCPVCDQGVRGLAEHVSDKLRGFSEQHSAALDQIEGLMRLAKTTDDSIIDLSNDYLEISTKISEIDQQLSAFAQSLRTTLARYSTQSIATLDDALKFETRLVLEQSTTEEALLATTQLCSELRSRLAIAGAQSKGFQSEIMIVQDRQTIGEARLVEVKKKFHDLEYFVQNIQNLRQELASWRTGIIEKFADSSANAAFGEFFARLVHNETFGVQIESARIIRNRPQIEWRAVHRAQKYVAEGVFSQAELNACAIALFLALATTHVDHPKILLLDDPVQNMDEFHIEEFGQTLKLLKDTLKWQIIIGVHDVSVYNYFKRQLYPSQEGQSLCGYIVNNAEGRSTVTADRSVTFEPKAFDLSFGVAS